MGIPSGTITFLFTDIEGSTKLWERFPEAMRVALARHDEILRDVIEKNNGYVFKTVGDAFCAAFPTAPDALKAALESHLALLAQDWGETGPIRVRMGIHTGEAEERDNDYFGQAVNRVARLQGVGHGQQTLISLAAHQLVYHSLPPGVTLQDMGEHRLKDLQAPEHVYQLLHPLLPTAFPPLKSLEYYPTNLPRQMTSFIGREEEIAEVKRLLPTTPMLMLLGTGGAGKTRLALQVGADVLDDYDDGVWLVELGALSDPELIPQAVAGVLGLREEADRPVLQIVQEYLRSRKLLLILDNCEHIVDKCAHLADALLTNCPNVTILATSREPLNIAGERSWRVPPLLTPGPDSLNFEEKDDSVRLMQYDACRLFVERAVLQRQDFILTRTNGPVVAHLCQQLDGIPLAIELAAARVRSLTVEEIEARLDDRFRLLIGGNRTALPRQQTLLATIQWSYDLLNSQEQSLLCRLSVFVGGWTLEAAEAVCSGAGIEESELLNLIAALVDKSLVVAEQWDEHSRYHLLESIQKYGEGRLEERGERVKVQERHLDYFLGLAEEANSELSGPDQIMWLNILETDFANLRAAHDWCFDECDRANDWPCEKGLRLTSALHYYESLRGRYREGLDRTAAALARDLAVEPTRTRAVALQGASVLSYRLGDYATSRAYLIQSLAIFDGLDDQVGIAAVLSGLGNIEKDHGKYEEAKSYYLRALPLVREIRDVNREAIILHNLGNIAFEQGDDGAAHTSFSESLSLHRNIGDKRGIAGSLAELGKVAKSQGDLTKARDHYRESLFLSQELNDKLGVVYALQAFANLAKTENQVARAVRLNAAMDSLRESIPAPLPPIERKTFSRILTDLRAITSEEAFAAAWAEGHAMTMEQAIEYALDEDADSA